ncbi:MAG: hypothetical protein NVS3B21_35520 [Acidimicrobiales bacterium]
MATNAVEMRAATSADDPAIRALFATSAALGATMSGFAAWLVVGLLDTVGAYAHNSMTLAHAGPGLFVVLAGTVIVAASAVAGLRRASAGR